jgi:hypothetical protein
MYRKRSAVWQFFTKKGNDEAECNSCKKSLNLPVVLNLHYHTIKNAYNNDINDVPAEKQMKTTEMFLQKRSMEEEIAEMACYYGMTFNTIASCRFIQENLHRLKTNRALPKYANMVRKMILDFCRQGRLHQFLLNRNN